MKIGSSSFKRLARELSVLVGAPIDPLYLQRFEQPTEQTTLTGKRGKLLADSCFFDDPAFERKWFGATFILETPSRRYEAQRMYWEKPNSVSVPHRETVRRAARVLIDLVQGKPVTPLAAGEGVACSYNVI